MLTEDLRKIITNYTCYFSSSLIGGETVNYYEWNPVTNNINLIDFYYGDSLVWSCVLRSNEHELLHLRILLQDNNIEEISNA